MTHVSDDAIAAWTRLTTVSRKLLERVEGDLKAAGLPPLAWYDALLEIERAGPEGIRPFELRPRLLLPQYGTSRLVDRLVREGLIRKKDCAGDGRGHVLYPTTAGRDLRRRMWEVYARALGRDVAARLSAAELGTLAALLSRLDPDRQGVAGVS